MKRLHVVSISIALALFGAILPIMGALAVSWHVAVEAERERLAAIAERVIGRATLSFADASAALQAASAITAAPCTEPHIRQMRAISMTTRAVEEIGYFADGFLKCTSWGPAEPGIAKAAIDHVTKDGIEITARMQPLASPGKAMTAFHRGAYNALVDPARFVDVIVEPGVQIAFGNRKGGVVAKLNGPDRVLVSELLSGREPPRDSGILFGTADASIWRAVAIDPPGTALQSLRREQALLPPVGLFIAGLMVATVWWLSRRRLSPLGELATAIHNREFVVHYQPIIELATGACIGAEALVRWLRPDGTLVRPDLFIPLAEDSGLITAITDQVIERVVFDLNPMLVAHREMHVAINLCAQDIKTGRALGVIRKTLEHTGIRTDQIWLEATERGFMDLAPARATIEAAQRDGHVVAIDDFGTGYSSLKHLQGLPLDVLKIDKAFTDAIHAGAATSAVTSHIIEMGRELGMQIVAEGIEHLAQVEYLVAKGVGYGQGWYFAKALPPEEFIAFYLRRQEILALTVLKDEALAA